MRFLVDLCQFIVVLLVAPVLAWRSWRTGKYRTDWDQRRGWLPERPAPTAGRPRVWIHAVSVGEMNAVRGLITAWQQRAPHTEIVISCTTDTGIARARELFPTLLVFRYPLDFSRFVRRAFDRIRPDLIVLVELEVWFNFVTMASQRGIPVAVVNGRLSEKSARMFAKVRPIAHRMFRSLAWVGAQDEAYAQRFLAVGVPADRVHVTGSLKWETAQIADSIPGALDLARAMGLRLDPDAQARDGLSQPQAPAPGALSEPQAQATGALSEPRAPATGALSEPRAQATGAIEPDPRVEDPPGRTRGSSQPLPSATTAPARATPPFPIWVCGSTGPGEEEIILDVLRSFRKPADALEHLQLVIVPRKPERFDEVASLIERAGFVCVRRTQCPDGTARSYDERAVHLVDTMGELRKVYSLADVVFVGRSLVPMGGSDMMEVAALAKPIIVGPHTRNFADAMQQLLTAQAVIVVPHDASETGKAVEALAGIVVTVIDADRTWQEMGGRARKVVQKNLGATQRTLDQLLPLVQRSSTA